MRTHIPPSSQLGQPCLHPHNCASPSCIHQSERVIENRRVSDVSSEEDICFSVEEVVVTSQPDEDVQSSTLTTGPAPHVSTLTSGQLPLLPLPTVVS